MLKVLMLVAAVGWCQQVPDAKPTMLFSAAEMQAAKRDPKQFTLAADPVRIEKRGGAMKLMALPEPPPRDLNPNPIVVVDQIIDTGLKIWKIVEDNKPVVDVKTQYASAVPEGITNWAQLSGWGYPEGTGVYGFTVKNFYGVTVVDVSYQVVRTAGGSYKGKGHYLTGVTIEPLNVSVAWGYHVTLAAEVTNVTNADTTGTNPLAGMMLSAKLRIQTAVKDEQGEGIYYLQGDGFFKEVGGPFQTQQIANVRNRMEDLSGSLMDSTGSGIANARTRVEALSKSILDSTGGGTANAGTEMEALSTPINCHAYPAAPGCPDFCHHHHGFPGCNPRLETLSSSTEGGTAKARTQMEALSTPVNCHAYPAAPGCPDFCRHHHGFPGCNPRMETLSVTDSTGGRVETLSVPVNCKAYPAAPGCPAFCRHHHGFPGCNPRMEAFANCASNPLEPGCPGFCANEGSQMYPGCPMYCSAYPSAPECQD